MPLLILGAFLAGVLTVLAPCVLPLLPVIIGGSVSGNVHDRRRPVIIAVSLAVSLLVFTVLLKATTLFITIPPTALSVASGVIIILLGVVLLFPRLYAAVMIKLGLERKAQELLAEGEQQKSSLWGPILTGAALGPVFSSCSPVYVYILATILPARFGEAMVYIFAYVIGLSLILLLISSFGQRLVRKLKFASKPDGWFQRTLAVVFIVVGLGTALGYNTKFQVYVANHTPFNFDALSAKLIPPSSNQPVPAAGVFNVQAYPEPELTGAAGWINSPPLTLASLKGKVVLIDFWTYSCINCIRNNPYIEKWYQTYKDQGFVVIGVHAPEFAFEKVQSNVEEAVKEQGLTYPVMLDNDLATWNAFNNQYWPAGYLIDTSGNVRRVDYGEGDYIDTEQAIRQLLAAKGPVQLGTPTTTGSETVPIAADQTPETYLGTNRAANYVGTPDLSAAAESTFTPTTLQPNQWTLGGTWDIQDENITAHDSSTLSIQVRSKEAYIVVASSVSARIDVLFNGQPLTTGAGEDVQNGVMNVTEPRLYRVTKLASEEDYLLTLQVPNGVTLSAFTFGD